MHNEYNFMTSSVSGQDESESRAVNWLPERARWSSLTARDTGFLPQGKFSMFWCFIPYNKSFIDQACSVKMVGYWPRRRGP